MPAQGSLHHAPGSGPPRVPQNLCSAAAQPWGAAAMCCRGWGGRGQPWLAAPAQHWAAMLSLPSITAGKVYAVSGAGQGVLLKPNRPQKEETAGECNAQLIGFCRANKGRAAAERFSSAETQDFAYRKGNYMFLGIFVSCEMAQPVLID